MTDITIKFVPEEKSATVPPGTTLLEAAHKAGAHINASCGGHGTCGKCRVVITDGTYDSRRSEKLSDEDWAKGVRLACLTVPQTDIVVDVPLSSRLDRSVLRRKAPAGDDSSSLMAHDLAILEMSDVSSAIVKRHIRLSPPTIEQNMSDLSRLIVGLRQEYGYGHIEAEFSCLGNLSSTLREADWNVTALILHHSGSTPRIIGIEPGDSTACCFSLAVDIGTTTVWVQLLDSAGNVLAETSDYNPQITYGEDVITRILYALKPEGLEQLRSAIVRTINMLIQEAAREAGVDLGCVPFIVVAGNSTMTHLFLGITPKYIRESPYVPAANIFPTLRASEAGIDLHGNAHLYIMPNVASYVGGDIVAGVLACGIHHSAELVLFIDVGTNGEIVLGNGDWMVTASCSAGPAFEGGGVKHGMRATRGAIESASIDPETLEPSLSTIGTSKPIGICGSGMINIIAEFLTRGIIDSRGKFRRDIASPRIREGESGWEYVLAWESETTVATDIVITEVDIENIVRTKGAIYAGCKVLLNSVGLDFTAVDRFIIAGGFGSFINVEKAVIIGMLPDIPRDRFVYVGNSSLSGARLCALSSEKIHEAEICAGMMTNIELSNYAAFMDEYVASLFLPHTDGTAFPSVMEIIGGYS